MKKLLFLLVVAGACLTSCHFIEGGENYTPNISTSIFYNTKGDTLRIGYNSKQEKYYLDTIHMGDTIRFGVQFMAYANNLVQSNIDWEKELVSLTCDSLPKYKDCFENNSVLEEMLIYYKIEGIQGYYAFGYPIELVPLKPGKSELYFYVKSDADSEKIQNENDVTIV
ncbi:MAG: hypothetical protein MJZ89_06425, partial [Paludibacteraceae bacterium]|nr:hypothetical protein [Paludibacteraceae bacterium]